MYVVSMKKSIRIWYCTALAVLSVTLQLKAQFPLTPDKSAAGKCYLFSASVWAGSSGNMAATDSSYNISAGVYSQRSFLIPELNEAGLAINFRLPAASHFSAGYSVKGYALFKKYYLAAALSKQFGKGFSSGLRFEMDGIEQGENYGRFRSFNCSGAFLIRLSPKADAATHFRIPVEKIGAIKSTTFSMGIRLRFSEVFNVTAESSLSENGIEWRGAFNYYILRKLLLTGGLGGVNLSLTFGMMLELHSIKISLAAMHQPVLGFSPAAGIMSGIK